MGINGITNPMSDSLTAAVGDTLSSSRGHKLQIGQSHGSKSMHPGAQRTAEWSRTEQEEGSNQQTQLPPSGQSEKNKNEAADDKNNTKVCVHRLEEDTTIFLD